MLGRLALHAALLIILAAPAAAQDAPAATWRSRLSPLDSMFVTEGVRGQVMLRVPGRYVAVGFWNKGEFVGVAREPEFEPGEDPIGIVRHRAFPARKLSDSLIVTSLREGKLVQDVNTETWEFTTESAEAFSARIDAANLPRTDKLPAPGDFVAFDEAPVVLEPAQLQAPDSLLDAKHTRTVLLRVLVNKDGHVLRTSVIKSQRGLDAFAEQAAMATRFRPAMRRGRAVVAWTTFPVEFRAVQRP